MFCEAQLTGKDALVFKGTLEKPLFSDAALAWGGGEELSRGPGPGHVVGDSHYHDDAASGSGSARPVVVLQAKPGSGSSSSRSCRARAQM